MYFMIVSKMCYRGNHPNKNMQWTFPGQSPLKIDSPCMRVLFTILLLCPVQVASPAS